MRPAAQQGETVSALVLGWARGKCSRPRSSAAGAPRFPPTSPFPCAVTPDAWREASAVTCPPCRDSGAQAGGGNTELALPAPPGGPLACSTLGSRARRRADFGPSRRVRSLFLVHRGVSLTQEILFSLTHVGSERQPAERSQTPTPGSGETWSFLPRGAHRSPSPRLLGYPRGTRGLGEHLGGFCPGQDSVPLSG